MYSVWLFHGEGSRFSSGVFTSFENANDWIVKNKLTGLLTEYPLDQGVYDWAIVNNYFEIKRIAKLNPDLYKTSQQVDRNISIMKMEKENKALV